MIITAACILSAAGARNLFAASAADLHTTDKQRLDSLDNALPFLEDRVLSTVMFGASSPISFTGEVRLKGQDHSFVDNPAFLEGDRSRMQVTGGVRLGMVVQPGRNLTLWSKLGFTSKFPGNLMRIVDSSGLATTSSHYYSNNKPVNIFEDMCAGIAINTTPASFWLKLGSIIWTEASPLTIWKAEPRSFAWDYLEYEEEQPVSEYFQSTVATGEKTGRAAWHKKAFNGINLESIKLPADLYFNFLYAKFPEYDAFEREYMDFATDLGYAAEEEKPVIVETGYSDSYRHTLHARLAKKIKALNLGLNYNRIITSDDIIYAQYPWGVFFNSMFSLQYDSVNGSLWATEYLADSTPLDCGKGFYKEPQVFSIDLQGSVGSHITLHTDVGFSVTDTTWVWGDTVETNRENIPLTVKKREHTYSDFVPAVYTTVGYDSKVMAWGVDLAYIKKGFYSPFSFAAPMDAFFAFGSNCLGTGTFVAKSEASPYFQNMAGAQLTVAPKISGYGHFRVKYGQHFQPEKGRDLLFFPYRLNGQDLNTFIKSTYTMFGVGTVDFPMPKRKYDRRMGDESYDPHSDVNGGDNENAHLEQSPEQGGLRADYHSMFEGFVPYDDSLQVLYNILCRKGVIDGYREVSAGSAGKIVNVNGDTVTVTINELQSDGHGFVPMHKKYTFNFEVDAAYDVGPLIRYKNEFFLAGYAALNGVSTAFKGFAVNDEAEDMLLWSVYLRFEPYIALTKKLYCGLLLGYENWRSNKAWMNLAVSADGKEDLAHPIIKRVPINYKDAAYGISFEWDALERMGLHGRFKWMTHKDESFTGNNYSAFLASLEIAMFF